MNAAELIARTRMSAFLDDANTDFTDSWILREMYDQLTQLYERAVVRSRQGFWVKKQIQPIVQGVAQYRMPRRAVAGGLQRVQIAYDSTLDYADLDQVDEAQAQYYELGTASGGQQGRTARYVLRGDTITLLPTPDGTALSLRIFYYLKPSRIIPAQAIVTGGLITSVNASTRVVTIQDVIRSTAPDLTNSAMTAGSFVVDVVEGAGLLDPAGADDGGGWHEVSLPQEFAVASAAGLTWTFSNTSVDLSNVRVGDWLRSATQTDWPCIPDDYHRTIADATAAKILRMRSMDAKAEALKIDLGEDLARFGDLLLPRVQNSAKAIVAPYLYRGVRRGWLVKYP